MRLVGKSRPMSASFVLQVKLVLVIVDQYSLILAVLFEMVDCLVLGDLSSAMLREVGS